MVQSWIVFWTCSQLQTFQRHHCPSIFQLLKVSNLPWKICPSWSKGDKFETFKVIQSQDKDPDPVKIKPDYHANNPSFYKEFSWKLQDSFPHFYCIPFDLIIRLLLNWKWIFYTLKCTFILISNTTIQCQFALITIFHDI